MLLIVYKQAVSTDNKNQYENIIKIKKSAHKKAAANDKNHLQQPFKVHLIKSVVIAAVAVITIAAAIKVKVKLFAAVGAFG